MRAPHDRRDGRHRPGDAEHLPCRSSLTASGNALYTQADAAVEMKLGRNFDKVRRMLDERGPARRALYEARHDRRMGNHVDAPDGRRASAGSTGSCGNTRRSLNIADLIDGA
ncbi:hypothetical protein WL15_18580 [Burkholderia multivorans]|nr:hypothetical protein WL15_18580 [Burkholderia multivorans]